MAKKPSIKVVLFDVDDTLFPSSKFAAMARENAIDAMIGAGLKGSRGEIKEQLYRIICKHGSNYGRHFDLLCRHFKASEQCRVVASGIAAYHDTKSSIQAFPGVKPTLLSLLKRGYIIAAATEGEEIKQWDKLIRLGVGHLFHKVFVTKEKNCKFYKGISRKLKVIPANIIMVGNNPKKDIFPAKQAGMKTIRMNKVTHWRKIKGKADYSVSQFRSILKILP